MKVVLAFVLIISAVSSLGSGPYLPSGWRPSGPSFFLPSEVRTAPELIGTTLEPKIPEPLVLPSEPTSLEAKTPESTVIPTESTTLEDRTTDSSALPVDRVQDVFGQETEASGSDFLREYGPPAALDIHQSVTVQGLPDIVTEQTFRVVDANNSQNEPVSLTSEEEVSTFDGSEAPEKENASVESQPKSSVAEVLVQTDASIEANSGQDTSTTEAVLEDTIAEDTTTKIKETISEEETTPSQLATDGNDDENSVSLVKTINTDSSTQGTSLEYLPPVSNEELGQDNDVITKEDAVISEVPINTSNDEDCDVKSEENSGLGQVPDVLSEQERIGFREYGPPISGTEGKSETERIENNETRRRRFSSKFASFNKH